MTIYAPEGVVLYDAPLSKEAIIHNVLMEDYYIELSFNVVESMPFGRGCYILYKGQKFEIFGNVLPEEIPSGGLRYTLRFEAQQSQMKRCKVFWRKDKNLEVSFTDTTSLSQFAALIVENVNAFLGGDKWRVGSIPAELEKHLKAVSFNGDSCWDAVNNIAETFDVEWWAEHNPADDSISLCFGKLEKGTEVTFERGDVVSSIPSNKGNEGNYGTRFYVFGSTKNLPADYSSTMEGGVTNGIVEKRLHLPDGKQYIDAKENLSNSEIIEQVVFFDDIFPTNVETITSLVYTDQTVIEGRKDPVWTITCDNSPLTLGDIIEGEQIQANFTSGDLIGQTFDIEIVRNGGSFDKQFKIVPKVISAESGIIIPRIGLAPHVNDTFILIGVNLPEGRVTEAEYDLLEAGTEYTRKNSIDTDVCQCPTNPVYCHENDCNYELGQRVRLIGDRFGKGGRSSRIQGYEKKLYDEYQATYTVGDNSAYSRLASIEKAIQKNEYSNRTGLEANIIRAKGDRTTPSDSNIFSALAVESYFLNKRKGGVVDGATNFNGGLSVNGNPIVYNAEDGYWELIGDLIVSGAITMFGASKGFTPSTIMDAVQVDGRTIVKNAAGQLVAIGGGGSGGGLVVDDVNALIEAALVPVQEEIGLKWTEDSDSIYRWNLAFSWGDHSKKGYALKSYVDDELTKYILLDTAQGVNAQHDFKKGLFIDGLPITKVNSNTIFLDANLVIGGAITMFGNNSSTFKAIWENIPFDLSTMEWTGSVWRVKGDGSGSVDDARVNVLVSEYLTKNSYATQDWVQGQGYATQSWVEGKKYLTGITSSQITTALGYTPYNSSNPDKYIKGIDYDMVIAALGYTPYSTTNPMGYLTISSLLGYATEQWVSNQGYAKQSSLNGVDNRLKSVETFFATSDTDSLVNKWSEIVTFLNATEGDTLDNILKTKANQSALDAAVASLAAEIGKKWTQNDTKIANWDSAYGWGNHANAGYAAKTYVDGELAKYVTLATAQPISARHNFSDGLQIGGITIRKSQDGTVYIDGNLVIKGALTMFGSDTTVAKSIWENIPFGDTMVWNGAEWNVADGAGGGSIDDNAVKLLISEALVGYETFVNTKTWVQSQGYLTQHQSLAHLLSKTDAANTYLSKSGGTMSGVIVLPANITIDDTNGSTILGYDSTMLLKVGQTDKDLLLRGATAKFNDNILLHSGNIIEYTAGKANKLSNKVKLWGNEFDGSSDVYNALTSRAGYNALTLSDSFLVLGYDYARNGLDTFIDGGAILFRYGVEQTIGLKIDKDGNVVVGDTTAEAKLHVHGDAKVDGNLTAKQNIETNQHIRINAWSGYGSGTCAMWYNGNTSILEVNSGASFAYDLIVGRSVAIGRTSASAKLHVGGDIIADGAITMFSQLSMKNVIDYDGLSLAQLVQIKPARFTWKDGRDNLIHVGGIADEVMKILPEVVYRTTDDKLTMDYGSAAFYVGTSLIKPVVDHEQRLQSAEKEIKDLKAENKRLREQLRASQYAEQNRITH